MDRRTIVLFLSVLCILAGTLAGCMPTATKPTIVIVSPPSGSQFRDGESIGIQSSATDPTGVTRVELLVDGRSVRVDSPPSAQGQPSFTLIQSWNAISGTHMITVRAFNAAGTVSDPATITVNVAPAIAAGATATAPRPTSPGPAVPTVPAAPTTPCTNGATFVADVTVPDNTTIAAGETFIKIWRLHNGGTCTWGSGYQLVFKDGEAMTTLTAVPVPNTAPGATADLQVTMTSPAAAGSYSGRWELRAPSGTALTVVTIKINVSGAAAKPTAPTSPGALSIASFNATVADGPTGKRVTFTWQTSGGTRARIVSGTAQRFPQAWEVVTSGTLTVDIVDTFYPNPQMTLFLMDDKSNQVSKSVQVYWPCKYNYYFTPAPGACPAFSVTMTQAADERFENGRMIWVKETRYKDTVKQNIIYVLFNNGTYEEHQDTWVEGQPESDPAIVAPAGLFQPIRGFGKLWRENVSVRQRLGWATTREQGYDGAWQPQMRESIPSVAYVRAIDNRVIQVAGQTGGSWKYVTP